MLKLEKSFSTRLAMKVQEKRKRNKEIKIKFPLEMSTRRVLYWGEIQYKIIIRTKNTGQTNIPTYKESRQGGRCAHKTALNCNLPFPKEH